ncbi:hypothetical protein [Natrarchaeobaculum aegyptiacum]|uniref:Transcriptional regulator n=1 Tax=Natrarchaeobaculum aegyptiacum TaxID=745377 RepID=A0A2Z2HSQ5_9EURY|nr:hypothetical protein [Natrarchaeobaculum aegyptiacum]ARS89125.1 hypothetical protein B1756_04690 [Natrarchaeobaculum aegyptiacum]
MVRHRNRESRDVVRRWDRIFEVLATEPRRQLVLSLAAAPEDEAVGLPEAAANPRLEPDPSRLTVELHHRHLPILADAEYVEWQRSPFTARRGPRFDELEALLESLHDNADEIPDLLVDGCQLLERTREQPEC